MKKLFYIALMALAVSCTDMLQEESYSDIPKSIFVNNAREAELVLLGVYRDMIGDNMYSYNLSFLFDITTDIAQCEGSSANNFREIPANAFTASNTSVLNTWKSLYKAIFDATDFVETVEAKMDGFTEQDRELAKIYIGEAKGLRGLFYFELLRLFGNIPLVTSTSESYKKPTEYTQADPVDVFKYIERNLLDAAEVLPWSTEDHMRNDNSFRFSRGAALGLLAKVYATWAGYPVNDTGKWKDAAITAGLVVGSGKHQLLPDFADLWKNCGAGIWAPKESLIEVSFYAPVITGTASQDPTGRVGKWNGVVADQIPGIRGRNAGNVKVTFSFLNEWRQTNDPRYKISVADYKYVGNVKTNLYTNADPEVNKSGWQLFTPAKWDTELYVPNYNFLLNDDQSNVNWYILRYADVVLLYAEALNEAFGPSDEAFAAVNLVRRRGFNTTSSTYDIPNTLDQEALRQAIRKERAYELCFEGGRRQDLVRWGIYYETIRATAQSLFDWNSSANYVAVQYTIKGKHELFPIPQRECDLMKIKQNPKW